MYTPDILLLLSSSGLYKNNIFNVLIIVLLDPFCDTLMVYYILFMFIIIKTSNKLYLLDNQRFFRTGGAPLNTTSKYFTLICHNIIRYQFPTQIIYQSISYLQYFYIYYCGFYITAV